MCRAQGTSGVLVCVPKPALLGAAPAFSGIPCPVLLVCSVPAQISTLMHPIPATLGRALVCGNRDVVLAPAHPHQIMHEHELHTVKFSLAVSVLGSEG